MSPKRAQMDIILHTFRVQVGILPSGLFPFTEFLDHCILPDSLVLLDHCVVMLPLGASQFKNCPCCPQADLKTSRPGVILLMIEILHDFTYRNRPKPFRKHGSILCIGSCRISIISSSKKRYRELPRSRLLGPCVDGNDGLDWTRCGLRGCSANP